jgi:hypothetical protein
MIDRNMAFYDVGSSLMGPFAEELAPGTMLDGELVKRTDDTWAFVLFDVVAHKGETMRHVVSMRTRLETVWEWYAALPLVILPNGYPFHWMTKSMYSLKDPSAIDKVLSEARPYETDGLVLTPLYFAIPFETSPFLFKWKPDALHSVDFRLVGHAPTETRPKWGLELKYRY